ncbi:hypothetical protein EJB05_27809, partial [Eragrostis curvula]
MSHSCISDCESTIPEHYRLLKHVALYTAYGRVSELCSQLGSSLRDALRMGLLGAPVSPLYG